MNRPTMLALAALIGFAAPSLASADDELDLSVVADDDDEFDFLKGNDAPKESEPNTDFDLLDAEEDEFSNFKLAPAETDVEPVEVQARGQIAVSSRSSKLPFDVAGKVALEDNFPAQVVYVDNDAVVIELPVLVARDAADHGGVSYWLVAEVYSDGMKVAESRQLVNKSSVAQTGPTIAFFKMLAPVPDAAGTLEIRVGQAKGNSGAPEALFTKPVKYKLGS